MAKPNVLAGWEKWVSDDDDGSCETFTIGIPDFPGRPTISYAMVAERVPHFYADLLLHAPMLLEELRSTVTWIEEMAQAVESLKTAKIGTLRVLAAKLRGRGKLIDLICEGLHDGEGLPASGKAVP